MCNKKMKFSDFSRCNLDDVECESNIFGTLRHLEKVDLCIDNNFVGEYRPFTHCLCTLLTFNDWLMCSVLTQTRLGMFTVHIDLTDWLHWSGVALAFNIWFSQPPHVHFSPPNKYYEKFIQIDSLLCKVYFVFYLCRAVRFHITA